MEKTEISKQQEIDQKLDKLDQHKAEWLKVPFSEKINLLKQVMDLVMKHQKEWVSIALQHRKLKPTEEEEELAGGVMPFVRLCRLLIEVYTPAAQAQKANKPITFPKPPKVTRRGDQKVVQVFPWGLQEQLLFPGIVGELFLLPGKDETQGSELLSAIESGVGAVSLVLAAGNQSSISLMDALYKLYNQGQVVMLKHNPVNEYLYPIFDKVFAPFIQRNFFHQVTGGIEEGKYLTESKIIDNIHITGSDKTHDAIVWGNSEKSGEPRLKKEITSELGCVTPFIIVPGPWTDKELDYQAQVISGAIVQNVSFNCNACKLLVMEKSWNLRTQLINKVKSILAKVPRRYAYYAGAEQRYENFMKRYPKAEQLGSSPNQDSYLPWTFIGDIPPEDGEYALCTEPFCPIISETYLDTSNAKEFMEQAVEFCNNKVWGNLSCTLVIHPETQKKFNAELEKAIDDLKYGSIGINTWSALSYSLATPVWGAFPGNSLENIQSGRGFVHNAFLLDHPQKSVIRLPFQLVLGSKLPFFPNHNNKAGFLSAAISWEYNRSMQSLGQTLYNALWG
eukprot:TRINITY_DN1147_c0_g1_i1.p1 TRINITY_DN1147_c0_g1~~TRINITY_DN1147_c0_g1_i1.p1  ORF type:complete len:563 (-),score=114.95 TRINITY_DN1147_c0_g1_i1:125-1813(-)